MESGLEDRNNAAHVVVAETSFVCVSMKSGLEDRNNLDRMNDYERITGSLNEVRPGRPEQ